jgi:superfamily II DNA or RNA helicase
MMKMGFQDLNLKIGYNSENTDVVKEFFIPVLRNTKLYRRVSAYYSSNSLKLIAEGLSEMLNNNGTMKLLVSYVISEEDFNEIIKAKKRPDEILNSMQIDNEIELKELMKDENVAALGYLIATKRLEIKFVVCKAKGIFHLKFGILIDDKNDKISFSGSINETYEGLTDNIEEFKVFRSWITEERKYLEVDSEKFDNYWNEKIDRKDYVIVQMPERFKKAIMKAYEETGRKSKKTTKELPPLWPHQQKAIDAWKGNNYSGIVEMATGTGKTIVAVSCIKHISGNKRLLVIVGCPTKVLVTQWEETLKKYIENFDITSISKDETKDAIYRKLTNAQDSKHVLIGTYASLSKKWFTDTIIEKYDGEILFIGDEAHWLGAEGFSKALSEKYKYRLGLTATPMRYFDLGGTSVILNYFKDTVFKYTLNDAIRDGFLTPYSYHMSFTYLTDRETREYQTLTRKYARGMASSGRDKEVAEKLLPIIVERARIVKKAANKIITFRQILETLMKRDELQSLLIYVEDTEQLSTYLDVLDSIGAEYRRVDESTSDGNRQLILNDLAEGKIDCVIAMKVLDEGVDIPNAKRAIFVSSSGNPKQFIQRRGRILRKAPGKSHAEIYDICILVNTERSEDDVFKKIEEKISVSELKRLAIFSITASNKTECYKEFQKVEEKLNINVFDIINAVRKYAN